MLKKLNKVLVAIILYCMVSYLVTLPHILTGIVLSVIASQVSLIFPKYYKNTLLNFIPLVLLSIIYPSIFVPFIIGYVASIFVDLLSKQGCYLLYPITSRGQIATNKFLDDDKKLHATTSFLLVFAVITIVFSFYGVQILQSFDEQDSFTEYFYSYENNYTSEHERNHIHYVNIDSSENLNRNITTTTINGTNNTTTTTIITEYST